MAETAPVPMAMLRDIDISPSAVCVAVAGIWIVQNQDGKTSPGELRDLAGVSRKTLARAIAQLSSKGMIEFAQRGRSITVSLNGLQESLRDDRPAKAPTSRPAPAKPATRPQRAQADTLVGLYGEIVKPPSGDGYVDTSRTRARGSVEKLLSADVPFTGLERAIRQYARQCDNEERQAKYRFHCGTFFGRKAIWKLFIEANIESKTGGPVDHAAERGYQDIQALAERWSDE